MKFPFLFTFPIRRFSPLSHRTHQYTETNTYNNTYYVSTYTFTSTSCSWTFSSPSSSSFSSKDSDSLYSSSWRNFHPQFLSYGNSHSQSHSHNQMTRIRNIHFGRCHYHSQSHPLNTNSNSIGHWNTNAKLHSHTYTMPMAMIIPIPITFVPSHDVRSFSSKTKSETETDSSSSSSSSVPSDAKNYNKNKQINTNSLSNKISESYHPTSIPDVDASASSPSSFQILLSEFNKLPFSPLPHSFQRDFFVSPIKDFIQNIPKMNEKEEGILREKIKNPKRNGSVPSPLSPPSSSPPSVLSNSDLISCWWHCLQFLGGRDSTPHHSLSPFHSIYKQIMMSPLFSITLARLMEHEIHDYPSPSPSPPMSPLEIICFSLVTKKFHFPQSFPFIQSGWRKIVRKILPREISMMLMEFETQRKTHGKPPASLSSLFSSSPPPLSSLPPPPFFNAFHTFMSSSPSLTPIVISEFLDILVFSFVVKNNFFKAKDMSNPYYSPHLFDGIFHYLLSNYTTLPTVDEQYLCMNLAFRSLIRLCASPAFHSLYLSFWPYFVPILSSFPSTVYQRYPQVLVHNLHSLVFDPLSLILSFEDNRSFHLIIQPLAHRFLSVLISPPLLSTWKGQESDDFFISLRSQFFATFQRVISKHLVRDSSLCLFTINTLIPLLNSFCKRKIPPYDDIHTYWMDLSVCFKVIQHGAKSLHYLSILPLVCDMSDHCKSLSITLPSKLLFPLSRLMGIIGVSSQSITKHFIDATHKWISAESDSRRRELYDVITFISPHGGNTELRSEDIKILIEMVRQKVRDATASLQKVMTMKDASSSSSSSPSSVPLSQCEEFGIFHRILWSSITFAILFRYHTTSHYSLVFDILKISWSTIQNIIKETHAHVEDLRMEFIHSLRDLRRFLQYVTPWAMGQLPNKEILWSEKMEKIFTEISMEMERKNGKKEKMKRFLPTISGSLEKIKRELEEKFVDSNEMGMDQAVIGIHMNIISLLDTPTGNSDFDFSSLFVPFKVEFQWIRHKHPKSPTLTVTPTPSPFFTFYLCLLGTHDHLYDCHSVLDMEMETRIKVRKEWKKKHPPFSSDADANVHIESSESSAVSDGIQSLSPTKMRNSSKVELIILRNLIERQKAKNSNGSVQLFVLPPHRVSALSSKENCESTANQIHLWFSSHLKVMWEKKMELQRQWEKTKKTQQKETERETETEAEKENSI